MLFESVPNISIGRDSEKVAALTEKIYTIDDLLIAHIDSNYDANRTVYTFFGGREAIISVIDVMFSFAEQQININLHQGRHPRLGAVDVVPIISYKPSIPDEANQLAIDIAEGISYKYHLPTYLYDRIATRPSHLTLAYLRRGGLQAAVARCLNKTMIPDYGPMQFHPQLGATCVGAREIMVAFNLSINTDDLSIAQEIARDFIRQRDDFEYFQGRNQENMLQHSQLSSVRFLGWIMPTYQCCQISTNIYDINSISMVELYGWVESQLARWKLTMLGSELIGLTPLIGIHPECSENQYISYMSMLNLDYRETIDPKKRIIEFVLKEHGL